MTAQIPPREQGAALLLALWAMLAMALLLAAIQIFAGRDAKLAAARLEQMQLSEAADGMIDLTLLRLLSVGAAHPPVDGQPIQTRFAGRTGTVAVQDEAGKIDLNQAPEPLLVRLLLAENLDLATAQGLADKILDWREPAAGRRLNGAKAADYHQAGLAYGPRGGPMESIEELRLVLGVSPALYDRLAPSLTVASQTAWPDPGVAPPPVLRALPGMTNDRIAQIAAARAARLVSLPDGSIADSAAPPAVGRAFTLTAHLAGRLTAVTRRALVRLTGIPAAPMVIYQWQ